MRFLKGESHSKKVAPEVGLEPTTNRLTADRSTTELLRIEKGRKVNRGRVDLTRGKSEKSFSHFTSDTPHAMAMAKPRQ